MLYKKSNGKGRILTATLLSSLLITALAGTLLVNLATANPMLLPLKVNIISPQPDAYTQNAILVNFTYYAPQEFYPVNSLPNHYYYDAYGRKEVPFTPEFYDGSYHAYFYFGNGVHTLTIHVTAWKEGELIHYWGNSTVTFTVDPIPAVSILSPQNTTCKGSDVMLDFLVDQPVLKAAYSLDGQTNVTVTLNTMLIKQVVGDKLLSRWGSAGNTMLNGLTLGEHNVTVYAWDETGKVVASEIIAFAVGDSPQTTPSPSPTPNPTPTPKPEQTEPTAPAPSPTPQEPASPQEPEQTQAPFPTTWIASSIVASVAAISFGLAAYFAKFKKKRSDA